jgi:putative nucleotidyltransferase with HDIG domain
MTEMRDPYTVGHEVRVAHLASAIAAELGVPNDVIKGLSIAAHVHDVGKIWIPVEILSKPGRLVPIQYEMIKLHSQIGYEILKDVEFPWPVATTILQHHERIDGSGYPFHLKGDDILLEAKIIGVADVVEAMASHRPYRPALGVDKALEEITKNKGILYDSDVVDACLRIFKAGYQLPTKSDNSLLQLKSDMF